MNGKTDHYILATGGREVERLRLLQEVYGPGTETMFGRIGLTEGMRVVDIGCGSGNTACWVAERVGPRGSVVAIDNSSEQIEQARQQAKSRGLTNIDFQVADIYSPRLPERSFDVAYCRLVLMHLTRPVDALRSMGSLVRTGGTIACEEMDLSRWLCDPPTRTLTRFYELNEALGTRRGENFRIGASLHRLFREAGFAAPEVSANFALVLRGEQKRLLALTFVEFAPEAVREGLATQAEMEEIAADLLKIADDDTTLFGFPMIAQVWATC